MKKILYVILCICTLVTPSFSKVKWDLGLDTNNENILGITQDNTNIDTLGILSAISAGVKYKWDSSLSVDVESVTTSSIYEESDIDSANRITRLRVIYKF